MGHRTKVVIAVDSHNQVAVRGKLGEHDYLIAKTLLEAVNIVLKKCPDRLLAQRLAVALDDISGVGLCDDFERDQTMDVNVKLDIDSRTRTIHIQYRVDPPFAGDFEGTFEDFLSEYSLEDELINNNVDL